MTVHTPQRLVTIILQVKSPEGETIPITFAIPEDVFNELQGIAAKRGEGLVEVFLEALSLRRLLAELQEEGPDSKLIIKRGNRLEELVSI